jgi:hypothetical protein
MQRVDSWTAKANKFIEVTSTAFPGKLSDVSVTISVQIVAKTSQQVSIFRLLGIIASLAN